MSTNARAGRAAILAALLLAAGVLAGCDGGDAARAAQGERLYDGRSPLAGRIHGHAQPLPPVALACTNCHGGAQARPAAEVRVARAAAAGPELDRTSLTSVQPRRGGPATRFELATFCRLLRTGEDPAHVLLPRVMPRYEISDEQCAALWSHLIRAPRDRSA